MKHIRFEVAYSAFEPTVKVRVTKTTVETHKMSRMALQSLIDTLSKDCDEIVIDTVDVL